VNHSLQKPPPHRLLWSNTCAVHQCPVSCKQNSTVTCLLSSARSLPCDHGCELASMCTVKHQQTSNLKLLSIDVWATASVYAGTLRAITSKPTTEEVQWLTKVTHLLLGLRFH
jgi:hypothetical protein